jgi:hypothetical protein
LVFAGARQLRVAVPLSAKDTLDLQDAHREALALIEAASMGVGGFMGALGATALATATAAGAGAPGGGGGQRTSVALAAASIVARQERALKWSQGVLARALETREASFRLVCESHCYRCKGCPACYMVQVTRCGLDHVTIAVTVTLLIDWLMPSTWQGTALAQSPAGTDATLYMAGCGFPGAADTRMRTAMTSPIFYALQVFCSAAPRHGQ